MDPLHLGFSHGIKPQAVEYLGRLSFTQPLPDILGELGVGPTLEDRIEVLLRAREDALCTVGHGIDDLDVSQGSSLQCPGDIRFIRRRYIR